MKPLTRAAAPTATSRLRYHSGSEAVLRLLLCRPNCYTVIDPMETLVSDDEIQGKRPYYRIDNN